MLQVTYSHCGHDTRTSRHEALLQQPPILTAAPTPYGNTICIACMFCVIAAAAMTQGKLCCRKAARCTRQKFELYKVS